MSFFRKLGHKLAPMFRKLPGEIATFGRKLSSGATSVEHGLEKAGGFLDKVDKAVPNPITKTLSEAIHGIADVSGAVGKGGMALDQLGHGHFHQAYGLAKQGFNQAKTGVGKEIGVGAKVAPFIFA